MVNANEDSEVPSDDNNAIIVYSDDNTPTTADEEPAVLQSNIHKQADSVTDWFAKHDMICSSDKTKLLVIGTKANRQAKLDKENLGPGGLRAPSVVADEAKLAIVFTYFFSFTPSAFHPLKGNSHD